MRILITGSTGFIGSYLLHSLSLGNHEILNLKRRNSDLARVSALTGEVAWVDIEENWKEVVIRFQPEVIFHLAWNGVSAKDRVIWETQISNIGFQQELLDIALVCGTKKFIGVGSQSEYGDFEEKVDESYPESPKTAYAATKIASKVLLQTFCELNRIDWYWFRLFPVFGPYEAENWLIPSLIKSICQQTSMNLTPGEQILPYLYVGECANAMASTIGASGQSGVYNICADNPMPMKKLVEKIRDRINPEFQLNFGAMPYRYGQSMYMEGDTTKLTSNLYSLNTKDFDSQLDMTISYFVNYFKDGNKL